MTSSTRSATEAVAGSGAVADAEPLGATLARAIAVRDAGRLRELFATPVRFTAVTPRRFWDADTASGVVDDVLLGTWFDPGTTILDLVAVDTDRVGDCEKVTYRLLVRLDTGPALVEQVAYYATDGERITSMRLVCSGFRPVELPDA
jgi:hypothetical protein